MTDILKPPLFSEAKANNKRDPSDPFWKDADWSDIDASHYVLIDQVGHNVLIYANGNKPEDNILIHGMHMRKIMGMLLHPRERPVRVLKS